MKFHYSNLKDRIKPTFSNVRNCLSLLSDLLMIFLIVIVFLPARLISFGFMRKLSNYLLDVQSTILGYFVSKMFFRLYCC